MIEILDSRELTDKEKKKYKLQQELEEKRRELQKLESLVLEVETEEVEVEAEEVEVETDTNEDRLSGRAKLQEKIGSLSEEEEKIVSEAIKKDNQKGVLTDEELHEIKIKSQKEYDSITSDILFSPKKVLIFIVIMIALVLASTILSQKSKQSTNDIQNIIQNEDELVIEVELE